MPTENINVAWVEAAKEITVKVLDKMPTSQVNPDVAAETYKTVYKAVLGASSGK
jgi:hypothetical protein